MYNNYFCMQLLERVFNIMKQKNPRMVERKTRLVMKPPQVMRVGAKRTTFANFTEICKLYVHTHTSHTHIHTQTHTQTHTHTNTHKHTHTNTHTHTHTHTHTYCLCISYVTAFCRLHRQPKHVFAFLLAELGTNGSIDGNNQLIIKGRFQQKQIETVLKSYISKRTIIITTIAVYL